MTMLYERSREWQLPLWVSAVVFKNWKRRHVQLERHSSGAMALAYFEAKGGERKGQRTGATPNEARPSSGGRSGSAGGVAMPRPSSMGAAALGVQEGSLLLRLGLAFLLLLR